MDYEPNPIKEIFSEFCELEKTREHAEIRDYEHKDSFSLVEAAFLWFDLKPNKNKFHIKPDKKVLAIAKVIYESLSPLSDEKNDDWRWVEYRAENLKVLAVNRGVKPPFLFEEVRGDFNNWLRINDFHPDDTEKLTQGGYRSIAIMIDMIKEYNQCSHTKAIELVVGEAEYQKETNNELNIRGVGVTSLKTFLKNGTSYLKN